MIIPQSKNPSFNIFWDSKTPEINTASGFDMKKTQNVNQPVMQPTMQQNIQQWVSSPSAPVSQAPLQMQSPMGGEQLMQSVQSFSTQQKQLDQNSQLQAMLPKDFLSDPNSFVDSPQTQERNAKKQELFGQMEQQTQSIIQSNFLWKDDIDSIHKQLIDLWLDPNVPKEVAVALAVEEDPTLIQKTIKRTARKVWSFLAWAWFSTATALPKWVAWLWDLATQGVDALFWTETNKTAKRFSEFLLDSEKQDITNAWIDPETIYFKWWKLVSDIWLWLAPIPGANGLKILNSIKNPILRNALQWVVWWWVWSVITAGSMEARAPTLWEFAIGTVAWWALSAAIPLVWKWITNARWLMGKMFWETAEEFAVKGLINVSDARKVVNQLAETWDGDAASIGRRMLDKKVIWWNEIDVIDKLRVVRKDAYKKTRDLIGSIDTEFTGIDWIKEGIWLIRTRIKTIRKMWAWEIYSKEFALIESLSKKMNSWSLKLVDAQKIKETLDTIFPRTYKMSGETWAANIAEVVDDIRKKIKIQIETEVARAKPWANIRELNRDVQVSYTLENAIKTKSVANDLRQYVLQWVLWWWFAWWTEGFDITSPTFIAKFIVWSMLWRYAWKILSSPSFNGKIANFLDWFSSWDRSKLLEYVKSPWKKPLDKKVEAKVEKIKKKIITDEQVSEAIEWQVVDQAPAWARKAWPQTIPKEPTPSEIVEGKIIERPQLKAQLDKYDITTEEVLSLPKPMQKQIDDIFNTTDAKQAKLMTDDFIDDFLAYEGRNSFDQTIMDNYNSDLKSRGLEIKLPKRKPKVKETKPKQETKTKQEIPTKEDFINPIDWKITDDGKNPWQRAAYTQGQKETYLSALAKYRTKTWWDLDWLEKYLNETTGWPTPAVKQDLAIPEKNDITPKTVLSKDGGMDKLKAEAKKYKTADEFVEWDTFMYNKEKVVVWKIMRDWDSEMMVLYDWTIKNREFKKWEGYITLNNSEVPYERFERAIEWINEAGKKKEHQKALSKIRSKERWLMKDAYTKAKSWKLLTKVEDVKKWDWMVHNGIEHIIDGVDWDLINIVPIKKPKKSFEFNKKEQSTWINIDYFRKIRDDANK